MLEWIALAMLMPLPFVVWWTDRRKERLFLDRLFTERVRSNALARALQDVLAHPSDPDARLRALDTLWTHYEDNLRG